MVFNRSLKTDIKSLILRHLVMVAIILMTALFAFNVAFSQTGMNIPVEITWSDQGTSFRPSSVTLRLFDGNMEVKSITLTSANQDPLNANKWVGSFDSVPYSANYTIVEDGVTGYTISGNNATPVIDNTTAILNSQTGTDRNGSVQLGDANFVLVKANVSNSTRWSLWTLENYSGDKYTQLINALKTAVGDNSITINSSNYSTSLPTTFTLYSLLLFSETVEISGSEGNITYDHSYLMTDRVSAFYYGNVVVATSDSVVVTNVENVVNTHTLTVHHVNEDNTQFAPDVVTQYDDGDTYTASPISNDHYSPELVSGSATGTITNDMELTYVYHPLYHDVIYQFTGSVFPPNTNTLLPATEEHLHGSTVTVAQDPTAAGYRFLGWKINGADAGTSFTMPTSDVTITGSWEQFNGYFTPSISMNIENESDYYRVLDTVTFAINVTNSESYPIHDVVVDELLDGATFIAGSDYTVISDQQASIPTIAAGETVTLYATYQVARDVTETITNTAEITSATAANYYYLNPSHDYEAEVDFDVHAWQDEPVVTGINSNSTTLYYVLMLAGAIGAGIGVVNINNKKKITKGRK